MLKPILLIAACGLLLRPSVAQVAPPPGADSKVSLPIFVNDDHDKPLAGVTPSNLQILDNKKAPARVLEIKNRADVPILLGMLIDTSASQHDDEQFKPAVREASDFTRLLLSGPDDRGFYEQFSLTPEATPIKQKSDFLALNVVIKPAGGTALFDALRFACDQRMKTDPVRNDLRVIVLLSDGEDNQSRTTIEEVIAIAQRTGVVIFAVDTSSTFSRRFSAHTRGTEILQRLARETGGVAFVDLDRAGMSKAFTAIKEQIDNVRLLTYVPADPAGPSHHSLKIEYFPRKPKVNVRVTHGYYSDLIAP